ncbi:hypothetical protein ON010_g8434 [Phytophthora cinnamomi]|nr:hypothetical protein ON010_g8434 [Phytophthora cinnamomi]
MQLEKGALKSHPGTNEAGATSNSQAANSAEEIGTDVGSDHQEMEYDAYSAWSCGATNRLSLSAQHFSRRTSARNSVRWPRVHGIVPTVKKCSLGLQSLQHCNWFGARGRWKRVASVAAHPSSMSTTITGVVPELAAGQDGAALWRWNDSNHPGPLRGLCCALHTLNKHPGLATLVSWTPPPMRSPQKRNMAAPFLFWSALLSNCTSALHSGPPVRFQANEETRCDMLSLQRNEDTSTAWLADSAALESRQSQFRLAIPLHPTERPADTKESGEAGSKTTTSSRFPAASSAAGGGSSLVLTSSVPALRSLQKSLIPCLIAPSALSNF